MGLLENAQKILAGAINCFNHFADCTDFIYPWISDSPIYLLDFLSFVQLFRSFYQYLLVPVFCGHLSTAD